MVGQIERAGFVPQALCWSWDRAGMYPLRTEVFMVLPVLRDEGESNEIDYLVFLCRENLIFTIRNSDLFDTRQIVALDEADSWLPDNSIPGVLSASMIVLSLKMLRRTTDLRNRITVVEDQMEQAPEDVTAKDIQDLRKDLLVLGSVVSDQLPVLQALNRLDRAFLGLQAAREYLNCAETNLLAADGSLTWMDARISALRSGFEMFAQGKTNHRLNMLTILSAIFMPITLMAGIWGMNFENMPGLSSPWAYYGALGSMAAIVIVQLLFFRRRGWFD